MAKAHRILPTIKLTFKFVVQPRCRLFIRPLCVPFSSPVELPGVHTMLKTSKLSKECMQRRMSGFYPVFVIWCTSSGLRSYGIFFSAYLLLQISVFASVTKGLVRSLDTVEKKLSSWNWITSNDSLTGNKWQYACAASKKFHQLRIVIERSKLFA